MNSYHFYNDFCSNLVHKTISFAVQLSIVC